MEERSASDDDTAGTTTGGDVEGADDGEPEAAAGTCSRRAQKGAVDPGGG